jgi:dolichol-phosphate mannosyltransferase
MITVVLLAYNEGDSLPGLVPELERILASEKEPHRFVVVDDGSRDNTAVVARELADRFPLIVISHSTNLGVAKAFDSGLRFALNGAAPDDLIFTMEGDKTNDPACLPEMIGRLREGCDVVCASRQAPGGAYVGFPIKRHLLSLGANLLTRLVFRVPGVLDYTIFYRGYRASVLARAVASFGDRFIECRGFVSNAEILLKLSKAGPLRCAETPMIYRYDLKPGASSMRVTKNLMEYLQLFVKVLLA